MTDSFKIFSFFISNSNKNLNDTIIFNPNGFSNGQTDYFLNFIENTNLKNIYFFSPYECYYPFTNDIIIEQKYTERINKILEDKDINVKIVYCSDNPDIYENQINKFNGRIAILYWPTAVLMHTYEMIFWQYFKLKNNELNFLDLSSHIGIDLFNNFNNIDITTLYSHYNNRPRYHRCMMMDFLSKDNLIEFGINSWNDISNTRNQHEIVSIYPMYKFKYWKEEILKIDSFKENGLMMSDTLLNQNHCSI